MKTESTFAYVLRLTITLLLITAVVAAALAGVNAVTAPEIARINAEKTQKAIEAVLEGGYETEITDFVDETGIVSKIYAGPNGYAVEVTPAGFDNTITMMVGVDLEGKVTGISVISHTETAGLGEVAAEKGEKGTNFRSQFVGLSGEATVSKDGGDVEAITGATITSRAICAGVTAAVKCVGNLG